MPTNRTHRTKKRRSPMSDAEWLFFLAKSPADFEKAQEADGGLFWWLYYHDGWREALAVHKSQIEAEWRARGWTPTQKAFVLRRYLERGYRLPHDILSSERQEAWHRWEAHPDRFGIWDFGEYLRSIGRPDLIRDIYRSPVPADEK